MRSVTRPAAAIFVASMLSCSYDDPVKSPAPTASDCDVPGNRVQNCGLDTDNAGWTIVLPGSGRHVSGDGSSRPGCIELTSVAVGNENFAEVEQCVVVSPNTDYDVGADVRVVTGTADDCELFAMPSFATSDCSDSNAVVVPASFSQSDLWSQSAPLSIATISNHSFKIIGQCRSSSPFTVRFDDFFFTSR